MYYITIRQRGKPRRRGENPMGFRDSDSLLHSLSSGLWAPQDSLECPFLFLLSFLSGHSETPAENRRRFFYKRIAQTGDIYYCFTISLTVTVNTTSCPANSGT